MAGRIFVSKMPSPDREMGKRKAKDDGLAVKISEFSLRASTDDSEESLVTDSSDISAGRKKYNSAWKKFRAVYGSNFSMMTGKELARIEKPAEMVTYSEYRTQYMTETFAWDYNKYGNPIKWLREGNPETGRFFKFCDRYKMSAQFDLVLLDSGDRLKDLTTADVQKKLCGALNAKRTFIWIFGVNSEVIVEGCVLDRDTRDTIRQSFSFALESEFVPPLECHNMANITFIPVHGNESNCFVIEITLNCTSDRMYQLSSGRVFFMKDDGKIDEIANMTEARRIVLYKEIEHLKEQCSADEEERKRNLGTPV